MGPHWERLAAGTVFWGVLSGVLLAGGMTIAGLDSLHGVHGGMRGLVLNPGICVSGSPALRRDRTEHPYGDVEAEQRARGEARSG